MALPNQNPDTPSVPEEAQLPSATPSLPSSDADFLQSLLRRIEAQSPAPEIQPPPSAQTPSLVSLASIRRSRLAPWALAASLLLFLTGLWRIDRNPQTPSDDLASWAVLAEADPGTAWADLEDLDDSLATELDTAQELEAAAEPDLFAGAEASTEGFEEGLWADLGDQEIAGWGPDESLLEELEQLPPADREHLIQFFEHS